MQTEYEIDALLSREHAGSVIDRLMSMPRPTSDAKVSNEWDRAVAGRFEAHLAKQMRDLIDGTDNRAA
ncbi:hypothetical protein CYK37_19475 [Mesorhizobium loti]|nr:hypothetical protein [Mesorhizobium loti]PLP57779.1 hypothetical protein CYK37_19475 [Mesorhizobium loti]